MIFIEIVETGERLKLDGGFFVRRLSNGTVVRCHEVKAQGVCDGENTWSLGSLEGIPKARIITLAEYLEALTAVETDPELTDSEALEIIMGGTYEAE